MHMPSEIPILSQSRPGLKARAQNLIQTPVGPTFEVPTGKPSLPHASLTDHLNIAAVERAASPAALGQLQCEAAILDDADASGGRPSDERERR